MPLPASSTRPTPENFGWDPYEVWRTRVFRPLIAVEKLAPKASPIEEVDPISPSLVADTESAPSVTHPRRSEEALKRELRAALSYLLLAGLNGLFAPDTEARRNWRSIELSARSATPIWTPVPRGAGGLRAEAPRSRASAS